VNLLRDLIREEIKKLLQDDALFREPKYGGLPDKYHHLGLEPDHDEPDDQCHECEKTHPDPCPGHATLCTVEPSWP